jgi:alpha-glucosidase (family GH31 glycosyl hydrolase)
VAEAAAVKAIRLRYTLLPYIYAFERQATESGIGIVRPMFWMFPDDRRFTDETSQWMFGDALLISPVVVPGEREHRVVLPEGVWYDYARGNRYQGMRTVRLKVNDKTWDDIPMFVREGSILATQPVSNYVGETPVEQVTLNVFPAGRLAQFTFYDDDGVSYAYEHSAYFKQAIVAQRKRSTIRLTFSSPEGTFHSTLKTYLVVVHGVAAKKVVLEGPTTGRNGALEWSAGRDRFGSYTQLRVPSGEAVSIALQ